MNREIVIVDRGRGPQLSTSRVTVQDLVPYFQRGCTAEEIRRWIPTLTHEEITVAEDYYRAHQAALDEQDQRIREEVAEEVQQQRLRFPEPGGTIEERRHELRQRLEQRRQEKDGGLKGVIPDDLG